MPLAEGGSLGSLKSEQGRLMQRLSGYLSGMVKQSTGSLHAACSKASGSLYDFKVIHMLEFGVIVF